MSSDKRGSAAGHSLLTYLSEPASRGCHLGFGVLLILVLLVVGYICTWWSHLGGYAREAELRSLMERSLPLIEAIEAHDADEGAPPVTLNDLVPAYLPAVPSTGWPGSPDYYYDVISHRGGESVSSRWKLTIVTSSGFLNADQMVYKPEKDYGTYAITRIDDWAYVHE